VRQFSGIWAVLKLKVVKRDLLNLGMNLGVVPNHRDFLKFVVLGRGRSGSNLLATARARRLHGVLHRGYSDARRT